MRGIRVRVARDSRRIREGTLRPCFVGAPRSSVYVSVITVRPHSDSELTRPHVRGVLRIVTDTCVRLWRRVHMDLIRYAGCVCRPSC
ncbi:putative leader peptide [Streptomyces sp. NBC_00076]|uniref:putative leader peptide n=1 Tax=Streptomyces sp. NBC_00076 TaxID=2975642 RepID=UPI003868788F